MSDPLWMAVPPGGYRLDADEMEPETCWADIALDAAIEEYLMAKAERKERGQ